MSVFIVLLLITQGLDAFTSVPLPRLMAVGENGLTRPTPPALLMAAKSGAGKRRRRRKDPSPSPSQSENDLPDFDDEEDAADAETISEIKVDPPKETKVTEPQTSSPSYSPPLKRGSGLNAQLAEELGGNVEGLDEDFILSTMRGKRGGDNWQPPRSIQETLNDRSLERFMDFDAMIERDSGGDAGEKVKLPTMEEVISRRKQMEAAEALKEGRVDEAVAMVDMEGMGKKAARAAQRKAAAIQRESTEESGKSPLDNLSELKILKLLENGAWVGIGLLVLWEVYINSPFFERAAPLIPVVYESDLPPGV